MSIITRKRVPVVGITVACAPLLLLGETVSITD